MVATSAPRGKRQLFSRPWLTILALGAMLGTVVTAAIFIATYPSSPPAPPQPLAAVSGQTIANQVIIFRSDPANKAVYRPVTWLWTRGSPTPENQFGRQYADQAVWNGKTAYVNIAVEPRSDVPVLHQVKVIGTYVCSAGGCFHTRSVVTQTTHCVSYASTSKPVPCVTVAVKPGQVVAVAVWDHYWNYGNPALANPSALTTLYLQSRYFKVNYPTDQVTAS